VGRANRLQRRAKLGREKERRRRQRRASRGAPPGSAGGTHARGGPRWQQSGAGGQGRSAPELAEQLVSDALCAQFRGDHGTFSRCAARLSGQLGGPSVAGWQRNVDRALLASLVRAITAGWRQGWQPAEVVRQVGRQFGARHARMATDAVAAEMRGYAAATVDERWEAQLAALGASAWWGSDDGYLELLGGREQIDRGAAVTCALETLFAFAALPEMGRLCALPGTARRSALNKERQAARPVDQRMLTRVRALLAKAESTEFPEEAEALTSRAQELMARHSIDDALLAAAGSGQAGPGRASGRRLFIDSPYEAAKAVLLDVVAGANRCRAIWHKNLGLSTVLGFPGDLDAVELLFTSLLVQATTALVQAGSRRDCYGRSRTRSFRQSFLTSYAQRIGERLAEAAGAAERQAVADAPGANLLPVLAARHRAVDEAVEEMFPELTQHAVGSVHDRDGWISGRAAADLATLNGRREVTGDAA
jgi:Protein of unknown function (DUF2786)